MVSFVSVYVDMAADADALRAAISRLPMPKDVVRVEVDDTLISDTFGCRIAVDLTGTFDEQAEGPAIARRYAATLSGVLGVPAYALYDLLRRDYSPS